MSRVVRKPSFCICETKDAAVQRLCFRYTDSTIPLLPKSEISSLCPSSVAVQPDLYKTWSETPKTGFLTTRPNYSKLRREAFSHNARSKGYNHGGMTVIRRMKSLVCVSIDTMCVFVPSVLNWKGKNGEVSVGLIILYKFSAKCRLLLCRSFQMISTLNDDNYMYIKPMIEACRRGI